MRRSAIWYILTLLWVIDAALAWRRHDLRQAAITALVAMGFLAVGIYFRLKDKALR